MLTAFRLGALFYLLQCALSSSSESSDDSFCSQAPEAKRICREMQEFFEHGWRDEVLTERPSGRDGDMRGRHSGGPHLRAFMRKVRSIAHEVGRNCKSRQRRGHSGGKSRRHYLVGNSPCTWGPSYWCSSLNNAEKCGTHGHCATKWANQSLRSDHHDDDCMECQRAIACLNFYGDKMGNGGKLRGYSLDALRNLSQAGVTPSMLCYYMGRCKGKPDERQLDGKDCVWAHSVWIRTRELYARNIRDFHDIMDTLLDECFGDAECQRTVLHALPVFVSKYGEYLAAGTAHDGETPCVDVKLCKPNTANAIYCDVCLTFMASVKRALQHNSSIEVVRKIAKGVCVFLGNKRKDCEDYIDHHVEKWVDDIDHTMDPVKICEDMKLCSSNKTDETAVQPAESNSCEQCESFVTRMRMRAICPIKKFFNFFLAQFCRFFGSLENKCVIEVDSIKDSIVSLINSIMKTSTICSPFCNGSETLGNVLPAQFSSEWVWRRAANGVCSRDEACEKKTAELLRNVFAWLDREEPFNEDRFCVESKETMCKVCKFFDSEALAKSFTENPKEIKLRVRQMCSEQPSSLREACDIFVDKYEYHIHRLLPELTEQRGQLCERLNLCATDDNCMICALMSRELRKLLPSTVTEQAVKTALQSTCDNLSGPYVDGCRRFVDNFEKSIIALMVKKQNTPRTLCRSLGVCYVNPEAVSMSTCEVCRFTVQAVERALTTNATEEQIMEWASKACDKLPGSYKEKCRDMIRNNLPTILEFLDSLVDPDLVCMKLGLCGPNAQHCQISDNAHALSSYCPLCEIAVEALKPVLEASPLVKMLSVYFEEACISQLPKEYHEDCRVDPFKHFCKVVKVCPLSGQIAAVAA